MQLAPQETADLVVHRFVDVARCLLAAVAAIGTGHAHGVSTRKCVLVATQHAG